MKEFTWVELLDCYNEAIAEYESAVDEQIFDDEESDYIAELRGDLEAIIDEIYRRKGEQG